MAAHAGAVWLDGWSWGPRRLPGLSRVTCNRGHRGDHRAGRDAGAHASAHGGRPRCARGHARTRRPQFPCRRSGGGVTFTASGTRVPRTPGTHAHADADSQTLCAWGVGTRRRPGPDRQMLLSGARVGSAAPRDRALFEVTGRQLVPGSPPALNQSGGAAGGEGRGSTRGRPGGPAPALLSSSKLPPKRPAPEVGSD